MSIGEDSEQRYDESISKTYFQLVLARNGSPGHVSIAQNAIGTLTQFRPAPAISAMSLSVYQGVNSQSQSMTEMNQDA